MAPFKKSRASLVLLLVMCWTLTAGAQTARSGRKTWQSQPDSANGREDSGYSSPSSEHIARMALAKQEPGLGGLSRKVASRIKRSNNVSPPGVNTHSATGTSNSSSTDGLPLLSSLPDPFMLPPDPPTTPDPSCRQRKTVQRASVSTSLSQVELSHVMEMCMSLNEPPFPIMFNLMNRFSESLRQERDQLSIKGENHAQEQKSRVTVIEQLKASDLNHSACLGPRPQLQPDSVYNLAQVSGGLSVYLVTGTNKDWGSTTGERLVLNSTNGRLLTVSLATTKMWRISGSGAARVKVTGQDQMSLAAGDLNVSLSRLVSRWSAMYTIAVHFLHDDPSARSGMLGDMVKGAKPGISQEELSATVRHDDRPCSSLQHGAHHLNQYKLANSYHFTQYLLDLLHDMSKNLPPEILHFKNQASPAKSD